MKPRGDIPVHVADVVAVLVLTDFAERHSTALERRMVLSRKNLMRESLRPNLDFTDLLQQFTFCHTTTELPQHLQSDR